MTQIAGGAGHPSFKNSGNRQDRLMKKVSTDFYSKRMRRFVKILKIRKKFIRAEKFHENGKIRPEQP